MKIIFMVRFLNNICLNNKIMKTPNLKLVIVTLFVLLSSLKSNAQYSEEEIAKKGYTTDAIINIIIDHLPTGWRFTDTNNCLIFQRTDSILELTENTLNVPFEKKEDKIKRIQAYGKKAVSKIVLRYETKWDFLKVQEVSTNNSSVYNELRFLSKKYKIVDLKDAKLSTKESTVYTPKNDADAKKIANYYTEKKIIEEKIIKSPDLSSQNYSLFIVSISGCNDENHLVFPDEASVEVYSLMTLCREIFGK